MSRDSGDGNYIPAKEIDDVEDDETDTNYIDPRRSRSKLKQLANNIPQNILKNPTLLEIKDKPYSVQKYVIRKNKALSSL